MAPPAVGRQQPPPHDAAGEEGLPRLAQAVVRQDLERQWCEATTPPIEYTFRLDYLGSTFLPPRPRCEMIQGERWCAVEQSAAAKDAVEQYVKYVIEAWVYENTSVTPGTLIMQASIDYVPYAEP